MVLSRVTLFFTVDVVMHKIIYKRTGAELYVVENTTTGKERKI